MAPASSIAGRRYPVESLTQPSRSWKSFQENPKSVFIKAGCSWL